MMNNEIPKDILPTLIVGLGGTGFQIIKRLKKLFNKRYNEQNLPIRYLILDTDLKSFLDDSLKNNEKCQLRFNEGVKSTLDWAYSNPNFDWLPENPPITPDFFTSTDQGAGLIRPIGRLYLCKNSKLVYDTLSTAKNDLVDLYKILTEVGAVHLENIDRHKVYIVGSLAGGTGCGTFLDVSVMLSKIFNRDNTNLIGMFTLESCYDDKLSSDLDAQNRSKANCYAALKELEFYMSSIKNPEDDRYTFKYNNIGEIKLEKKLLDICYLVENKNEGGGVLTNIEDIYDLCSLQLYHEIGTKLGSQLRADYANFICKDKDPVLKRDRHFSTFSSSSMEIPVENIKRYSCFKLASDILESLYSSETEEVLNLKAEELKEDIKQELDINTYLVNNHMIRIKEETLDGSVIQNSLTSAEKRVTASKNNWNSDYEINIEKADKFLEEFINENSIAYGVRGLSRILKETSTLFKQEANAIIPPSNVGSANSVFQSISGKLDSVKKLSNSRKNKLKKSEEANSIKNTANNFISNKENEINSYIANELCKMITAMIDEAVKNIDVLSRNIDEYRSSVSMNLLRLNNQANKTYGGNIISREMVSKDFYDNFYEENYGRDNLKPTITKMMKQEMFDEIFDMEREKPRDINILSLMNYDIKDLINLCAKIIEEDKRLDNLSLIDIMRKNAEVNRQNPKLYVKEELEIAAKLAKPFWSAIKNPEVSWTECYYIGAVKDDNITNGFTIRPDEEIDYWIRSQTGERSRQARYVETSNPSSIDVIHITMGACAGYLPDVKNYKMFYLKLLSEQTYPLHLDETYVGLDDLVLDVDELFKIYTLAQAYGAILKVHGKYIDNLSSSNMDGQRFVYKSDCNLSTDKIIDSYKELPKNTSEIEESIILGNSRSQVLSRIEKDIALTSKLAKFITAVEAVHSREDLIKHKRKYIELYNLLNNDDDIKAAGYQEGDFIAYEKLRYQNSFRK